jgi:hypothetical protein
MNYEISGNPEVEQRWQQYGLTRNAYELKQLEQGCQMVYYQTKKGIWANFETSCNVGVFYGHLDYFTDIFIFYCN